MGPTEIHGFCREYVAVRIACTNSLINSYVNPNKVIFSWWVLASTYLVGGIPTPLKNDGVKVSWDYDIPKIWKNPWKSNKNPLKAMFSIHETTIIHDSQDMEKIIHSCSSHHQPPVPKQEAFPSVAATFQRHSAIGKAMVYPLVKRTIYIAI